MQPLFILPNIILDETNYPVWLFRMESFLKSISLFDFVDGSSLCPPKFLLSGNDTSSIVNSEYVEWEMKDQSVIHMLSQTLGPVAMIWAVGSVSAAHMWDNLKQRFASPNRQNILQMKSNLYELKKGSDSIDEYLDKVKAAKDTLATVGVYLDDDDVLVIVLRGLPSSFAVIKTVIRSQPISLTLSEIRTLLKGAEYDINQEYMVSMPSGIVNTGCVSSGMIDSGVVSSVCFGMNVSSPPQQNLRLKKKKSTGLVDSLGYDTNLNKDQTCNINEPTMQATDDRFLKYTFQRKRKKGTLSCSNESDSREEITVKKRAGEKQIGTLDPSGLIIGSPRDCYHLVQVDRHLVSQENSCHARVLKVSEAFPSIDGHCFSLLIFDPAQAKGG